LPISLFINFQDIFIALFEFKICLYCHLWPTWLYHMFPHYTINGTAFWKKFIEHKMRVLIFLTIFFETIPILRRTEWDICHECKNNFM
jgi:hypothetical protein